MKRHSSDNIEDFLKERSDQYLIYPSDHVWDEIVKKLHPNRIWTYVSLIFLMVGISGGLVMLNVKEQKEIPAKPGQIAYRFIEKDPLEKGYKNLHAITISGQLKNFHTDHLRNQHISSVSNNEIYTDSETGIFQNRFSSNERVEIPTSVINLSENRPKNLHSKIDPGKKNLFSSTFDLVIAQAKKISNKASWQFYITPTVSYRKLTGQASAASYQYSSYSYSTNSLFARDVNDAVRHKPGIGLEFGTAMFYPLSKRLSLKTGLQINYNRYNIEAYNGIPEIATYGMNNVGYGGRIPISTISYFRNTDGYKPATLRNEHYMISMPLGLDYIVLGNKHINFSIASTIQPTFVFANDSYLISSNLKNYAKEPSLNRRWNINSSFEASLNIQRGAFKWSFAPQYRYQLISSFKDKYPIRENLTDLGLKVSLIRTIR